MKTGVYLQGGGAKGAFQAGVLCALNDRGVSFDVIAGTSVGAMNGYCVHLNAFDVLKKLWLEIEPSSAEAIYKDEKIIENEPVIELLREIENKAFEKKNFYVNYVHIKNGKMVHKYQDINSLPKEEKLLYVRSSGLLPRVKVESGKKVSPEDLFNFEIFQKDLKQRRYEGMNLDGGLFNNTFMEPFVENRVDKLFVVPFAVNFPLPEFIKKIYEQSAICKIEPDVPFQPGDTLRFDPEFCKFQFEKGYSKAKSMEIGE